MNTKEFLQTLNQRVTFYKTHDTITETYEWLDNDGRVYYRWHDTYPNTDNF